ncbi:MAG: 6-phosphogluconolactonase [Agromyces sp.]
MTRRVIVSEDAAQLASTVADAFVNVVTNWLSTHDGPMHIALTGGRTGAATLNAIGALPSQAIDWSRIHLWWGDERWLPGGDAERNDEVARTALLDRITIPTQNVHRVAASDSGLSLDEAAAAYRAELESFSVNGWGHPAFGLVFLGVGPDGHIASLFPHRVGISVEDMPAIAVHDSPKPPSERVSLTRRVLNSADYVWLMLTGADKAAALGLALAGASRDEVPAAGIKGRIETVYYVDIAAAANVPSNVTIRYAVGDRVGRD